MYNCATVEVVGSEFTNNTSNGAHADLPFRINAGGLSYSSHYDAPQSVNASFRVKDCMFTNNSALQTAVNLTHIENTARRMYSGRGGGIGAALGTIEKLHISVENCTFTRNTANVLGGGLYIITVSNATQHSYTIENCTFVENTANTAGGGVGLSLFFDEGANTSNLVQVKDSTFMQNKAESFGGGLYILPGNLMKLIVGIFVAAVAGRFEVEHCIRAMERDGFSFDNLCMDVCTDKHLL